MLDVPIWAEAEPWPDDPAEQECRFDPDRRRYREIPVVVRTEDGFAVERGSLPEPVEMTMALLWHALASRLAEPGTRIGIFADPFGAVPRIVREGHVVEDDPRIEHHYWICERWSGARTLRELVTALREVADDLELLGSDGWGLADRPGSGGDIRLRRLPRVAG